MMKEHKRSMIKQKENLDCGAVSVKAPSSVKETQRLEKSFRILFETEGRSCLYTFRGHHSLLAQAICREQLEHKLALM